LIGKIEPGAALGAAGGNANLEKAIDIKRRAQRCIQNGDLDGALKEYEKLIAVQDSDPYNYVLLADLLFKKGDMVGAAQRYVASIDAYEKATLYKNAIAVGKKMMRLSLSPTLVLHKLAGLHALDGLGTEAALYYQQYAEHLMRDNRTTEAADALRKAFEASPENIKALERLSEVHILDGDNESAARALGEAAVHYQSAGMLQDAERCRVKAGTLHEGPIPVPRPATLPPSRMATAEPGVVDFASPGSSDGKGLELEGSELTSISNDRVPAGETPASTRFSFKTDFENGAGRTPATPSEPPAEVSITHSMELTPAEAEPDQQGPPALTPTSEPAEAAPVAEYAPEGPGLRFESPAGDRAAPAESAPEAPADAGVVAAVERLLREAREQFRNGEREAASASLIEAARLYDDIGQHDSAATIYRNLSRTTHATREVMTLWLHNCESRSDRLEAAKVACELGDLALNEGDVEGARDWFQRASGMDATNETAKRRLKKLSEAGAGGISTATPEPDEASEDGRVEVAVGRGEAVTFDLGSLVSEFQRGVETQISGDPQGHYDLGMAYREMGLLEQAIDSFRAASGDPSFAQRCAEMAGRCMLDQGRFEDAAQEFQTALDLPGLTAEGSLDLRFQLGLAHEAAGRVEAALMEFERVYATVPSYPDVALKIRMLRKALESS
jgi:tetratricopeptide (TPR) repeat protein